MEDSGYKKETGQSKEVYGLKTFWPQIWIVNASTRCSLFDYTVKVKSIHAIQATLIGVFWRQKIIP